VDDHYQLLMARGLLDHPARPYDFRADDGGPGNAGWEKGGFPRMVNPPLHHYMAALLLRLSGDASLGPSAENPAGGGRLWLVRLGMAAFSALAAPLLVLLSRRCLVPPGPAAVLAVLTPAFWLSSFSLLIDATLLPFFLGALVSWIEGVKRRGPAFLILAGVLMGATLLTKYTGGFVGILALAYWALERSDDGKRHPAALLALLIPAAALAGWGAWTSALYGGSHLAESSKRVLQTFQISHVLIFLTFLSGVLLFPLESWAWAARRGPRFSVTAGGVAAVLGAFLASPWGGFSAAQAVLMAALAGGGALFLMRVLVFKPDPRAPTDLFLGFWLLLGTVQMIWVMQWVAARYYLTLVPPAVLLLLRAWDRENRHAPRALSRRAAAWGVGMFLVTAALARADWAQAAVGRRIVQDLARDGVTAGGDRALYYTGDSFTGSLLGYAGWKAYFPGSPLKPGDLILRQTVVMPPWWFQAPPSRVAAVYEYPARWPLRLMDNAGSAGFYASAWGALPWTFSRGPWERYVLLETLAPPEPS
jgi:hypothetical protein